MEEPWLLVEISTTSDTQMTPPSRQKVKRNWRASWWRWKKSEKAALKFSIRKTKIMASGPITSWQIHGETVADFIFLGSKITADDCSHEMKRLLLLRRKTMTKLDSILKIKSRDITLLTKAQSQSYGFSSSHVWMWELDHKEGWTLKNRCFWTVVLEKTLENPLDSKKIKQSILKEISSEYSLGRLMLKLQYFSHLMW